MNKYKLSDEKKEFLGRTLYRIVCVTAFASVQVGELGGWVESENNLSQYGNAWVYGDAKVCGNAKVYGNAEVYGDAEVYGNAKVYGNAEVYGDAEVCGNAEVYGDAWVCGNAKVYGNADYIVLKNNWSSGRYYTYTASNKMWKVGCFHGTGEELIAKAYKDSELSGKCYEASVRYVEELERIKVELTKKS